MSTREQRLWQAFGLLMAIIGCTIAVFALPQIQSIVGQTSTAAAQNTPSIVIGETQTTSTTIAPPSTTPSSAPSVVTASTKPVVISASQLTQLPIFKVEASSEAGGRPARYVFDESTQSGQSWFSNLGDVKGAWIKLFTPEISTLARIKVFLVIPTKNAGDQLRDVTLTFDDGSTYKAHLPFEDGWQVIDFPPIDTAFIKLTVDDTYPAQTYGNQIEIREIELHGASITPTPVINQTIVPESKLTQPSILKVETSSEAGGRPAQYVFDESTQFGQSWFSAVGDVKGAWIKLFISEGSTLAQVKVFLVIPTKNAGDQIRDVTLSFDDGSSYEAHLQFQDGWQTINIPPVTTAFIKITVDDTYPAQTYGNQIEIREIELYDLK